ncbi:hypothetical protein CHELA1G11_20894 [Hyphomicrobiales bacterium]|nr:hypothetical protein CHELA1G11_20894 [Hyphomicrobiales bacterium]CAH1692466.1 hypothetical protein CHELA1G2_21210 [Hyphomicrobiales bacterium]
MSIEERVGPPAYYKPEIASLNTGTVSVRNPARSRAMMCIKHVRPALVGLDEPKLLSVLKNFTLPTVVAYTLSHA